MPRPFSEFTIDDMKIIHSKLENYARDYSHIPNIPMYNLPLLMSAKDIHFDFNDEYRVVQYSQHVGEAASINVSNNYEIHTMGIDDDTSKLITDYIKGYLILNKFIQP